MKAIEQAKQFVENARKMGWSVDARCDNGIVTIFKRFEPNNVDEFSKLDGEYYYVLAKAPIVSAGSTWGTDGGGVGAICALKRGEFVMNRSGVSKRFLKAMRKYLIEHPDLDFDY